MSAFTWRRLLGLTLVLTLVAAYFAPSPQPDDSLQLSDRTRKNLAPVAAGATRSGGSGSIEVLAIRPRNPGQADDAQGVFNSRQWLKPGSAAPTAPKAVPVVTAAGELAQAPPLPFKVLGRYWEDGQELVFLQHNEQNLVVRVGDTIGSVYKVERLEGNTLTLRYTPLNQTQTLTVGAAAN
jgi:hypothetical protein